MRVITGQNGSKRVKTVRVPEIKPAVVSCGFHYTRSYRPVHSVTTLQSAIHQIWLSDIYANSKASGEPAHPCSLARSVDVCLKFN